MPSDEAGQGLDAELAWLLRTECPDVLERVRKLLLNSTEASEFVEGTKADPLRGGELEGVLRFAAALNGTAVEALQVQLSLPQLEREGPLRLALARGQGVRLVLPQLLAWRNLLGMALGVLAEAGSCDSLDAARAAALRLVQLLNEFMCAWPREEPPPSPSSAADNITQQMQPQLPHPMRVDVSIAGVAPRFYVSVYPSRDAAAEALHASAALTTLEAGLARAATAQRLCAELLTKLSLHEELRR
jgi:hypothetical protein